jgi:hypothetical protein
MLTMMMMMMMMMMTIELELSNQGWVFLCLIHVIRELARWSCMPYKFLMLTLVSRAVHFAPFCTFFGTVSDIYMGYRMDIGWI